MKTPQPICMVRDSKEIRPLMSDEHERITGFFLFGDDLINIRCKFRELPCDCFQRFLLDDDKIIGFDQIFEITLFGRAFLLLSIQERNGEDG